MQESGYPPPGGIKVRVRQERDFSVDPRFITATAVIGDRVKDKNGKDLGKIVEIMLDLATGTIPYLVLSSGGILGIGDRFYALPLEQLTFDPYERVFYLEIEKKVLKKFSGFDKEDWPQAAKWPFSQKNDPEHEDQT